MAQTYAERKAKEAERVAQRQAQWAQEIRDEDVISAIEKGEPYDPQEAIPALLRLIQKQNTDLQGQIYRIR
jgi:hypothetical protein